MGLYQRENGIYYLQVKENNKYKRISLETRNRYTAQEIYNLYLLEKVKNKINPISNQDTSNLRVFQENKQNKTTIKPLYKEYIESCQIKGLEKATLRYKNVLLKDLISFKIVYLEDINQKNISPLIKFWQQSSKDCMRKHIANFKAFLNYCIKSQIFDSSKYQALSFPTPTVNVRETVITDSDYKYMRTAIKDKDFLLYIDTLWETGCRPNEITGLKKSDIDFDKGIAKIYQSKTKKYKTVYLTDELLKEFENKSNDCLFVGYGKQKEYYAKKFKVLRDELDMNKEYCLYAFRHSFGTRMMNKTKDIHLVSKLLGHSDISITAKHYINRSDADIRRRLLDIN